MKIKYYIPALLCMMILFNSLPVSAAEVSGNDVNNGIMLLSTDDGIATAGTYYPNSILNDNVKKSLNLSYFTDIINLDFKLCDIYFNGDADFYNRCNLLDLYFPYNVTINSIDTTENQSSIVNFKLYVNINGKKYYFINQWESIVPDDYIMSAVGHFGIEVQINNKNNDFLQHFNVSIDGDATKNTYYTDRYDYNLYGTVGNTTLTKSPIPVDITVSWTGVEWDIRRETNTVSGIISDISNKLTDLKTNVMDQFRIFRNEVSNKFTELFTKMDEEQEEIINGYDDTQASDSNNELSSSLDTYQNTEQNITQEAFSGIGEYTVTEEGAQSFATQFLTVFPLVASMMQSFYQSASSFNIVISVIFTTIIASMVIGLFRFYRR